MNVLVVCKHPRHSEEIAHCEIFDKQFTVKYSWKNTLKPTDLKDVDFVVSIGGDGTALSASHFLIDRPLLAVNSAPETSVGALTTISVAELNQKIKEIANKNFRTEKLERIIVAVNGKQYTPLALNEVFIANEKAYLSSKYEIQLGKIKERHVSSGLIFSTGTGSTAWFKSAGGKPFSAQARNIEMLVREPYLSRLNGFNTFTRKINEGEEMTVKPLTPMTLAIDSIREVRIKQGDSVKIAISNHPLLRVV